MKNIYQVETSDYNTGAIYGAFEDRNLAEKLLVEVNAYFKENDKEEEAFIHTINVNDENDILYRYRTFFSIEDKKEKFTETITPSYIAFDSNIENIKKRLSEGYSTKYILTYGASKEESLSKALNTYEALEKENLIESLIKLEKEIKYKM